ncbi:hypothetical protein [Paenibacillus sanguinis]|uniref:hypothetical protein n=1 Tax=Paenibacillus sanguinis TaxID=225906 RepID=UPI00039AAD4D|nr:hypothetical protein [Paenibacillus sanguinis]
MARRQLSLNSDGPACPYAFTGKGGLFDEHFARHAHTLRNTIEQKPIIVGKCGFAEETLVQVYKGEV